MEIKGLERALKSENPKEAVAKLFEEFNSGLVQKRDELLNESKEAKSALATLKEQMDTMQAELAETKKTSDISKGNWEEVLKTERAQHAKEVAKTQSLLAGADAYIERILIDAELDKHLEAGQIPAGLRAGAKALISTTAQRKVTTDGDKRIASLNGQAVGEFVKAWLESESGKPFVPVPVNSGGGGRGGPAGPNAGGNPWAKDSINLTDQSRITRENPTLAASLKAAAGG